MPSGKGLVGARAMANLRYKTATERLDAELVKDKPDKRSVTGLLTELKMQLRAIKYSYANIEFSKGAPTCSTATACESTVLLRLILIL